MKTTTLTLPLTHLYQLTYDPANTTGYTIEEVISLIDQNGHDYEIEATIITPEPVITEEMIGDGDGIVQ